MNMKATLPNSMSNTTTTLRPDFDDEDKTLFLTARERLRYFGDSPLPRPAEEPPHDRRLLRLLRLLRRR